MPVIETRLRVMTWNLWWRFGPWERRLPAIAAALQSADADAIALQEVWDDGERNQAAELAEALGYEHVYASRIDIEGVQLGNAILSRWPIEFHETMPLPAPPGFEEYRLALRTDITGPRGQFQFFSTHLNWRFDQSHVRQEQVRTLARFIDEGPERTYPPVLCGDFNAPPDAYEIWMLTGRTTVPVPKLVFHDAWEAAGERAGSFDGMTWSNSNPFAAQAFEPNRRIDYVFAGWPKEDGLGQILKASVAGKDPVDGVLPSDHFALIAELRY
ncbi:MAG TPA: endonuclease/exonuclease/phosphatase family protein [Acidimicrobiales bacterium]|jgi:endonuclease/exonuclease/phosphatase family metal-dependent hydrolase|nr:endonuclease/exonuclease/phosphatase family protein [Acidimicrobiales bacterium]